MNPQQVIADLCPTCGGKGIDPSGNICTYCKGIGLIGKDSTNEYYLIPDDKGGLMVGEIKSQLNSTDIQDKKNKLPGQKKGVLRGFLFIFLIILYSGFIGVYILFLDNTKIFWLVNLLALGFLFLFFLYDARFFNLFIKILTRTFLSEPNDYLTQIQKIKKERGLTV